MSQGKPKANRATTPTSHCHKDMERKEEIWDGYISSNGADSACQSQKGSRVGAGPLSQTLLFTYQFSCIFHSALKTPRWVITCRATYLLHIRRCTYTVHTTLAIQNIHRYHLQGLYLFTIPYLFNQRTSMLAWLCRTCGIMPCFSS